jgi:hypothetical protein
MILTGRDDLLRESAKDFSATGTEAAESAWGDTESILMIFSGRATSSVSAG